MAKSTTPPPPKTGGSGYVAAGVVMLLAMGGLIYWKVGGEDEPVEKPPEPPKVEKKAPVLDEPPPPPPPPEEPKDAAVEKEPEKKVVKRTGGAGACSNCEGTATGALKSALMAKGGQARGCYNRALRLNPTLKGRAVVNVTVGDKGQVCSASLAESSLGDPAVGSCIVQMFRAGKFPAPNGGCVQTRVPLNFVPKQ